MKYMTRGQLHEHQARERMRALRMEPAITHGARKSLEQRIRDNDPIAITSAACGFCGYHVCSCKPVPPTFAGIAPEGAKERRVCFAPRCFALASWHDPGAGNYLCDVHKPATANWVRL